MNKKIKGYEVMKLIAEKKIKEGQGFLFTDADGVEEKIFWDGENFKYLAERNFMLRTVSDIEFVLGDFEILEDEEDDNISSLNAFKLMEAPYMAKCLDKNSHEEFMEHLKQSEVEIVHKIGELIEKVNKLDKKINKED